MSSTMESGPASATAPEPSEPPAFPAAWREINALVRRYGSYRLPPPEAFTHPAVAGFARGVWREICTGPAAGTRGYARHADEMESAYLAAVSARSTR